MQVVFLKIVVSSLQKRGNYNNMGPTSVFAIKAHWLHLHLQFCSPGFESQEQHLRFFNLYWNWTKISKKRQRFAHMLKTSASKPHCPATIVVCKKRMRKLPGANSWWSLIVSRQFFFGPLKPLLRHCPRLVHRLRRRLQLRLQP